jgi:hypothetical protein
MPRWPWVGRRLDGEGEERLGSIGLSETSGQARRRVYRFSDSATRYAAGRAIVALPCCTVAGVGARVALQRSPILRTGNAILSRLRGGG